MWDAVCSVSLVGDWLGCDHIKNDIQLASIALMLALQNKVKREIHSPEKNAHKIHALTGAVSISKKGI